MSTLNEPTVFIPGRIQPGTTLNDTYKVETPLAPGGMGEVYKGHELFTQKKVALKFIRRELEENADARQMFINEGNSLAELQHDAIVRCYPLSVDRQLGRLYLPMEFVDGPSLFDLMDAGPLPVEAVGLLLKRIGAGLQAAHEREIFHRDVSPDNIIVPGRELSRAKIIDFGIARSTASGRATIIGTGIAGKPNYMSPEQCGLFGGDVRAQSDIYSFGLVLAGALLGRPLDMGGSMADVYTKRQKLPDLTGIDPTIRPVIAAMVQPDPKHRPPSMSAVIELLPAAPGTIAKPQKPQRPKTSILAATDKPRSKTMALAAGGGAVIVVALIAFGAWQFMKPPAKQVVDDNPMRTFIASYGADKCLLIAPGAMTSKSADLTGFSNDPRTLSAFVPDFDNVFGFRPNLAIFPITDAQCQALAFVRSAGTGLPGAPVLTIDQPDVPKKNGRKIAGTIDARADAKVALYRVDENGTVQDLSDLLKPDAQNGEGGTGSWSFQPVLDRAGDAAPGPAPQMLVAVTSVNPVLDKPIDFAAASDQVFPALKERLPRDARPGVAVAVFSLVK